MGRFGPDPDMPTHTTTPAMLRLRSGPSTNHAIIARLPSGTPLELIVAAEAAGWAQVNAMLPTDAVNGWVKAEYIRALDDAEPMWLQIARGEIGVREVPGSGHNPRIIEYHQTTTYKATTDEVAWCSSFVNWCIQQAGLQGTRSAAAITWKEWGQTLAPPQIGCIVVLKRYDPNNPDAAHVAFFLRQQGQLIELLGGNQGNAVKALSYSAEDVLAYRWPIT